MFGGQALSDKLVIYQELISRALKSDFSHFDISNDKALFFVAKDRISWMNQLSKATRYEHGSGIIKRVSIKTPLQNFV